MVSGEGRTLIEFDDVARFCFLPQRLALLREVIGKADLTAWLRASYRDSLRLLNHQPLEF